MMMWEKLKLVAVGALVAVGLTAQALSQQAPNGGILAARPPQTVAQNAEKPNEKTTGDRRWVRSLPSGALIEVIGISSFPSGPDTWWRPDGTPLQPAPCDPNEPKISGDDTASTSWFWCRLARIPNGADHQWSITEARGKPRAGHAKRQTLTRSERDDRPAAGRCRHLHGPFQGRGRSLEYHPDLGEESGRCWLPSIGPSYIFGDAIATKKGTTLSVTHNIQDKPVRLVAVDVDGKELPAEIRSGTGVKDFQQIVVEFDQPPEQIKEFRLQTRPYEEVEIPRIALKRK